MKNFFLIILLILLPIAIWPQIPDQQAASPAQITQSETNINIAEPNQVLVVFKRGDDVSRQIKEHYVQVRNIPSINVVREGEGENNLPGLDFSTNTDIELAQNGEVIKRISLCANANSNSYCDYVAWQYYIDEIATPIANYLNNTIDPNTGLYLKDQIRYIVLCKGIPLKIQSGDPYRNWYTINVSVDGLLCLLKNDNNNNPSVLTLYPPTTPPGIIDHYNALVGNPYYSPDNDFSMNYRFKPNHFLTEHGNNGQYLSWKLAYLVSRLDGRNLDDVIQLIDRSVAADHSGEGKWIIDTHKYYSSDFYFPLEPWKADWYASDYNDLDLYRLMWTNNKLNNLDFNVVTDANEIDNTRRNPITTTNGQVMGYLSWGAHAGMQVGYINNLNFSYLPGAVFSSIESFNGYSMDAQFRRDGQGMITEFIQKGGTSGAGQTWEPFSNNVTNPFHSFSAYAMGYGFVDAMYQGYYRVGWQNIVVGDPLTTIAWGKQSLTENKTLTGTNLVTGVITIPSGKTLTIAANAVINFKHSGSLVVNGNLTIQQGAKLNFLNGASLIVNGTLNATGSNADKITFDFIAPNSSTQNCINVNQGGNIAINNAIIKNGQYGIYLNRAVATIANSEITGCSFGFVISGTNYIVTQPEITNCKIHANPSAGSGWGFLVSASSPLLIGNEIYDNFAGVFLSGLSQPSFGNQWNYGNNNIHNNTGYGIYESYYSPPFLGRDGCEVNGGRNILENNGILDLYVTSYVPVIAENNWWGSNSPSTMKIYSAYNTIDYYPWLGFRPTQQYANMKLSPEENLFNSKFDKEILNSIDNNIKATADISVENILVKEKNLNTKNGISEIDYQNIKPISAVLDSNVSLINKLGYAKRQIDLKHYQTAQLIAKEIIEKYPDSSASFFALGLLWQASKVNDLESYKTFLKNLGINKSKKELYGVAEIIESGFNKSDRFVKLNQIMIKYKKTKTAEYAYLDLFMYYAFDVNDKIKAKETGDLITSSFPNSPAAMMINELADINIRSIAKKATSEYSNTDNELPTEYKLLGNYPNPFNPSTTISYALPLESNVEINIFDIMGRLVRTFDLNGQSAGYQNVLWNGRNENNEQVASGIYLYRFKAVATDGKVFEKTSKLLMLK